MTEEKMLTQVEAQGVLDIIKDYMLNGSGAVTPIQRVGIGRMLSEVQYTLEDKDNTVIYSKGLRPV